MAVGEDGKVGVNGDVTVDRSGSEMLDGGWNCIWDDCWVSVEEDTDVGCYELNWFSRWHMVRSCVEW